MARIEQSELRPMSDFVLGIMQQMELQSAMRPVRGNWTDCFDALRHNYRVYGEAVERGIVGWSDRYDPYVIADWVMIFTPIEAAIWSDIRSYGLPFWPQFPVGRYVVDFADPVRKIALECDGAAYHDPVKDRARDAALEKMGWTTYRIPGRECFEEHVTIRRLDGTSFKLGDLRHA
jgi:very-short-patch-repair endonuclease